MEPTSHPEKTIERLYADHRRVRIVYGIAIIVVALSVTSMVLFTPNFQLSFSFQSPVLGTYETGLHYNGSQTAYATSTQL